MALLFGKFTIDKKTGESFYRFSILVFHICLYTGFLFCGVHTASGDEQKPYDISIYGINIDRLIKSGVNKNDLIRLTHTMEKYGFSKREIENIHSFFWKAMNEHILFSTLENKLYEGMIKGVPFEKIMNAFDRTKERYVFAHSSLQKFQLKDHYHSKLTQEIVACLTAGLTDDDAPLFLDRLRNHLANKNQKEKVALLEEFLVTTKEFLRSGVSSPVAIKIAEYAIEKQFTKEQLAELRKDFEMQIRNKGDFSGFNFPDGAISRRRMENMNSLDTINSGPQGPSEENGKGPNNNGKGGKWK